MEPTGLSTSAAPVLGSAPAVLELAASCRWRLPEATAVLADHAGRLARADGDVRAALRAEGWLMHGLAALGRGAGAVPRAVRALSEASRLGDDAAAGRLRVELASMARDLGDRAGARALLAPVLGRADPEPVLWADAHIEAVRGQGEGSSADLLALVDVVVGGLRSLGGEHGEFGLAALDAALARQHRERGQHHAAAERAREGLRRLSGERAAESRLDPIAPHLAASLTLELTLALLDGERPDLARRAAEPVLRWAGRPGSLEPVARLRLALAHRIHLPDGEYQAALECARWVSETIGQHDLPGIEADCLGLLAEVHELRDELSEALAASRRAHLAFRLHAARVEQALVLLARWNNGAGSPSSGGEFDAPGADNDLPHPAPDDRGAAHPAPTIESKPTIGAQPVDEWPTQPVPSVAPPVPVPDDAEREPVAEQRANPDEQAPAAAALLSVAGLASRLAPLGHGTGHRVSLVLIDVASPSGAVSGPSAGPLLERIAERVRHLLPPEGLLHVLDLNVVAAALPEVDQQSVARWVRSVSAALSAQWSEFAADLPMAVFRIAVGSLDQRRPAELSVHELHARLRGSPGQPRGDGGERPVGGRHLAGPGGLGDAGSTSEPNRVTAPPGSGGRRRAEPGRGPTATGAEPLEGSATDATSPLRASSGRRAQPPSVRRPRATMEVGTTADLPAGPDVAGHRAPLPADRYDALGRIPHDQPELPGPITQNGRADIRTDPEQTAHPPDANLGQRDIVAGPEPKHPGEAADATGDGAATSGEPPPAWSKPVTELSFAELLAGALAAYREG